MPLFVSLVVAHYCSIMENLFYPTESHLCNILKYFQLKQQSVCKYGRWPTANVSDSYSLKPDRNLRLKSKSYSVQLNSREGFQRPRKGLQLSWEKMFVRGSGSFGLNHYLTVFSFIYGIFCVSGQAASKHCCGSAQLGKFGILPYSKPSKSEHYSTSATLSPINSLVNYSIG